MVFDNLKTQDVLEVFLKCLDTGKKYFYGYTSSTGVTQKIKQSPIRAGIGNIQVGTISSEKEVSVKVEMPLTNDTLLEIQSGTTFATKTATVQATEKLKLTSGSTLTLAGTPADEDEVLVLDRFNKPVTATCAAGVVTLTGGVIGESYTILYPISANNASVLPITANDYPKSFALELHGIAYDTQTNEVKIDLYWQFDSVVGDGGFDRKYEGGKNATDGATFTVQAPFGTNEMGRYIVVERV